jgi:hypothetical protein
MLTSYILLRSEDEVPKMSLFFSSQLIINKKNCANETLTLQIANQITANEK